MSNSAAFKVLHEYFLESKIKEQILKYDSIKDVSLSTRKERIPFLRFFWKNEEIKVLTIEAIESVYVADILTHDLDVNKIVEDVVKGEKIEIKFVFLEE